jgi:nucleotide-binding universal stress UspA family protein
VKKILYATDFSENAAKALEFALNLAQKYDADLSILHVFELPTYWKFPETEDPLEMEKHAVLKTEQRLKEFFMQHTKTDHTVLVVDYLPVENNSVINGILTTIKELRPDLVVMGMKGSSNIRELVIGNATKKLIKHSPCPVLAIPENAEYQGFKNIVYATDYLEGEVEALGKLIEITGLFSPEIIVVHITAPNDPTGDKAEKWVGDLKDKVGYDRIHFKTLTGDSLVDALDDFLERNRANLLVMVEKERSGILDKLFHDDLVKKMEMHSRIPLLILNGHFLSRD